MEIEIVNKCSHCDIILTNDNWHPGYREPIKRICISCQSSYDKERNANRAVIKLISGQIKDGELSHKKRLLEKHPGSVFVGEFNRKEISLDDYKKSLGSLSAIVAQELPISVAVPKVRAIRKPPNAQQMSGIIDTRVETINSDRTINRRAREKKIWANLRDKNGVVYEWFRHMYDDATHCAVTGKEFHTHGMYAKSVDQIVAGAGYDESNIHVICRWLNFAKNVYPLEKIKEAIADTADHFKKTALIINLKM